MRIVIDKARHRLVLRQGRRALYRCRVHLGSNPVGHKHREGDGRTPEGAYFVCSRNPKSRFYRALGLSYPNERDARAGRAEGRLCSEEYAEICKAARKKRRPPWETPLGGWIMLHGEPNDGRDASGDWTAGCIAVKNEDMDVLYRWGNLGLRVIIRS